MLDRILLFGIVKAQIGRFIGRSRVLVDGEEDGRITQDRPCAAFLARPVVIQILQWIAAATGDLELGRRVLPGWRALRRVKPARNLGDESLWAP
ncbi:MAG: hypothetical protein DCC49_11525 [Acidobacteria bacterium]|nr:MAG: hypothetical protein DCC49_11525 [Acidobacteriota bacterium]